jgi:hypothetical protein
LQDKRIPTILAAFASLFPQLLMDFSQKVLVGSDEYAMARKKKPCACKLSLLGSLTTFLGAERIGGMFGWAVDKMTIWNAARKTASERDFKLDAKGLSQGKAGGTSIGIKGIAKREKELKVFVQ